MIISWFKGRAYQGLIELFLSFTGLIVSGGASWHSCFLDTADPKDPKVQGSLKGTPGSDESSEDSCPTDSEQDISGEDHRLIQIAQALYRKEDVTVVLKGYFQGYEDIESQVEFGQVYEGAAPSSLQQLFQITFTMIANAAPIYGSTGIPGSLLRAIQLFAADSLDISVSKIGLGLRVCYVPKEMKGIPLEKSPSVYTFDLADKLQIAFGAVPQLPDAILMQYSANFTSPWDGSQYGTPWQIYLNAKPWRRSDTGEIVVAATPAYPDGENAHILKPRIPMNSVQSRNSSATTRDKDTSRTLKLGRDNEWPLYISCASTLDGSNSATITYLADW